MLRNSIREIEREGEVEVTLELMRGFLLTPRKISERPKASTFLSSLCSGPSCGLIRTGPPLVPEGESVSHLLRTGDSVSDLDAGLRRLRAT